jgi:cytochrome c5
MLIAFLAMIVAIGILAAPSKGQAQDGAAAISHAAISIRLPVHGVRAFYFPAMQDASQGATPPAAPPKPAPVQMPEGDGKAIAEAACQACHRLTNLTRAHKDLDEWRDTVGTMIDRGANVPQDQVETLVQYLAKNFAPKPAASAADTQVAPSTPTPPGTDAPAPLPSPKPATVVMPEGEGKAIAEAACQACHRLTNLTRAHKSLDEWRDTVDTMIDRGANVPKDQVETLVQYLAKNFTPKPEAPDSAAPAGGATTSLPQ